MCIGLSGSPANDTTSWDMRLRCETPHALNPKPYTLNPKPKPYTPNPKPQTLNPKP